MNILVTGGSGFIGSHVVQALVGTGHQVAVFDNLSTGNRANLDGGCDLIEGDIRDFNSIKAALGGRDAVIHMAAYTSVPDSFAESALCFEVNVQGTLNVLEAAALKGVKKVIFASSSAVYAEEPAGSKSEAMCPEPSSPYGVSKLEGEHLLQWFQKRKGLIPTAFRFFNVYGSKQDATSAYAAVIPIFIRQGLDKEPMTVCGSGEQTRDFVHVSDVASAHRRALNSEETGVYNVGTGIEVSILELASMVASAFGIESNIVHTEDRLGDVLASTAVISTIRDRLGWNPRIDLKQGLMETIEWQRQSSIEKV